jgi:predicted AlkP superfamily phosphohydrolase/phosphomutase
VLKVKIMIVGFDGATWELINKFNLPTFRELAENGIVATMNSTIPPITIPAWPCMFSGYNPGKIGAVDFKRRGRNNSFELVNSNMWRGKLIWDRLKNIRFLVLNIPFTYPPYRINGNMVALDFSPTSKYTYPPELEEELESMFNVSSIRNSRKNSLEALYDEEGLVLEIFKYLTKKHKYDVGVVRFGLPDHVTHRSTEIADIKKCHEVMDRLLGEVIRSTEFEQLFLVSDHGVKKNPKKFCINTWLYRNGYLSLNLRGKMYLTLRRIYERLPFKRRIKLIIKGGIKVHVNGKEPVLMPKNVLNFIDYSRTKAFGILSNSLEFYPIYFQIREGEKEYKKLTKELSRRLLSIRDEDGDRVIKRVWFKRDIYSGEHLERMPDMVVESSRCTLATLVPEVFLEVSYYTHSMAGIFLAYGDGIKKGVKLGNIKIYDFAPTLYHLLGFPVPRDVDGRVLKGIFEPGTRFAESEPAYVDPSYYTDHKQALKRRIKKIRRNL